MITIQNFTRRLILLLALLLVCTACARETESPPPTTTTVRVAFAATAVPTMSVATREVNALPSDIPTLSTFVSEATETSETACAFTAGQAGAAHHVDAQIDYAAHTINVVQETRYLNRTNEALDRIVFGVEPNRYANVYRLESVLLDDDLPPTAYELTGRRLDVVLPQPLQPGCSQLVRLRFTLQIPQVGEGIARLSGFFGYTDRQINLGNWLPAVAARLDGAWVTHPESAIGEQVVSDVADWTAALYVQNAPENLQIAAPGIVEAVENGWTVTLTNARDFAVSLSDAFNISTRTADDGTQVELYTFSDTLISTQNGVIDGAVHALDAATGALNTYSGLFGAYPYDRFIIVEGDFADGMEFSGIVFVSEDWFRTYEGEPTSYLTIITVHETAHQWWYARVGNDQAFAPWLDEALATYSEYVFYEEYYPHLKDWWWDFRVNAYAPPSFTGALVDSTVYDFGTAREYINAVYLRGARMLHTLRDDMGTEAFFDWLARYAEAGQGRIVSPDLIWSLLSEEALMLTAETRGAYVGTLP